MTAFAMKGDRESLLADGFDGYIAKPINTKEIPSSSSSISARQHVAPQLRGSRRFSYFSTGIL